MPQCARCGGHLETPFRYCPWCAAPQRLKLVEFFRPHAAIDHDRGKALRVSRYLHPLARERHVRLSVWHDARESARAEAAISLDEAEAWRLAEFLRSSAPGPPPPRGRVTALLEHFGVYVREPR